MSGEGEEIMKEIAHMDFVKETHLLFCFLRRDTHCPRSSFGVGHCDGDLLRH